LRAKLLVLLVQTDPGDLPNRLVSECNDKVSKGDGLDIHNSNHNRGVYRRRLLSAENPPEQLNIRMGICALGD